MTQPLLTYVDSDVLIAASRFADQLSESAMAILTDSGRAFAGSPYLRLETLPKPDYNRIPAQLAFLEAYFDGISAWLDSSPEFSKRAEHRARQLGLGALDALHLEAAVTLGAVKFVTAERPQSPLFRETAIRVTTIRPIRFL